MLIGSQLQKAQLEVVSALPTTDLAIGRIVYLKDAGDADNSGLWMYNGTGWERILDPGLYDRIVGTTTADGVTPAAPTQDLNDVKQALVDLIDGSSTTIDDVDKKVADIIDGTNTSGGYISLLPNKTAPQEMSHTWNVNGRLDSIYGENDAIDGYFHAPFACEITGFSCFIEDTGDDSADINIDIKRRSSLANGSGESVFVLTNHIKLANDVTNQGMNVNYINGTTGVVDYTAATGGTSGGVTMNKHSGAAYPQWVEASMAISTTRPYYINIDSGPVGAGNLSVTLFFRRTGL
jgi:hypothetical protein